MCIILKKCVYTNKPMCSYFTFNNLSLLPLENDHVPEAKTSELCIKITIYESREVTFFTIPKIHRAENIETNFSLFLNY